MKNLINKLHDYFNLLIKYQYFIYLIINRAFSLINQLIINRN
jgi:hypothetical protein